MKILVYDEHNAHEYYSYSKLGFPHEKNMLYKNAILNSIYQFFYDFYQKKLDYEDMEDFNVRYSVLKSWRLYYEGRKGHLKIRKGEVKMSKKAKLEQRKIIISEQKKKKSERFEGSEVSEKERKGMYKKVNLRNIVKKKYTKPEYIQPSVSRMRHLKAVNRQKNLRKRV